MFTKGIRTELEIPPQEVASGKRAGWFSAVLKLFVKLGDKTGVTRLEIFARTKDRLIEFLGSATTSSAADFDMNRSIAQFVSEGRARLIRKFGNAGDVDVALIQQTRRLFVELLRPLAYRV
jgi:hypothetical protein